MSKKDQIAYWYDTGLEDFDVAEECFKSKRYNYALFFVHLSIEKLLKGLSVLNTGDVAPLTHNILELLKTARIDADLDQLSQFTEINTFNIRARYDDFKRSFFKKATKEYTEEYMEYARKLKSWLETKYQKK